MTAADPRPEMIQVHSAQDVISDRVAPNSAWFGDEAISDILEQCRPLYGLGLPNTLPQGSVISPRLEDSILLQQKSHPVGVGVAKR
eukprot:CAMPEP_0172439554 /NCGR_PEP_ID=MMETSP1065-20121228/502_1 /TAXON_ID=265537 /ORGANISM="Amphiprora paludosa, Strain CCMP125" /LENGTH=85 /DNA_ID=CAMNT_0013188251 /DNA_START=96 /DNA_END=353 /DNA_ORIENTATION=-